jgi:hypothetical protein
MAVFTGLGSAASPSITFSADTNTGIFSPGADQVAVATNGLGRLFITSEGRVGIGASAPSRQLTVTSSSGSESQKIAIENTFNYNSTNFTSYKDTIEFRADKDNRYTGSGPIIGPLASLGCVYANATFTADGDSGAGALVFNTRARTSNTASDTLTERVRIDDQGRLLVGTSSARSIGGSLLAFNVEGVNLQTSSGAFVQNSASTTPSTIAFAKSRGTSVGAVTVVNAGDSIGRLDFFAADGSGLIAAANITGGVDGTPGTNNMPGRLLFGTTPPGSASSTERMRIASSGDVFVGSPGNVSPTLNTNTGCRFAPDGTLMASKSGGSAVFLQRSTSDGVIATFLRDTTTVGTISVTATNTSYNTSSDYRLKENIVGLDGAIDRLKQLPVHRFNFIVEPEITVDGFIAHEAQEVVPECVTGTKDEMEAIGTLTEWNGTVISTNEPKPKDLTWESQTEVTPAAEATYDEQGNELTPAVDAVYETVTRTRTWEQTGERPVYQGIDQSKIVPLLTAALQEAVNRIESLEAEVTALKS